MTSKWCTRVRSTSETGNKFVVVTCDSKPVATVAKEYYSDSLLQAMKLDGIKPRSDEGISKNVGLSFNGVFVVGVINAPNGVSRIQSIVEAIKVKKKTRTLIVSGKAERSNNGVH